MRIKGINIDFPDADTPNARTISILFAAETFGVCRFNIDGNDPHDKETLSQLSEITGRTHLALIQTKGTGCYYILNKIAVEER